ncbi:uncharacterized protein LOC110242847 [Exaiptasia diaphana]|uniref:Uncharacterized protein n=1 Tax=Exaiptasia diaphana TaxID=2652724 RepID=A0A913XHW1_EXADI|nr:uncharacterized protein LOC110242847 [Exaiptasia diaphana]
MKVAVYFVLLITVFISCAQSQKKRGDCTSEEYIGDVQSCQLILVQDLQKNPKSDCSGEASKYYECAVKTMKKCYPNAEISALKSMIQRTFTVDLLCKEAALQFPTPSRINGTFPCKMDPADYQKDVTKCSEKLLSMWQANKADKGTCGEFKNTKQCIVKLAKDAECKMTEDFKRNEKLLYGTFNPFCPHGVDAEANEKPNKPNTNNQTNKTQTLKGTSTLCLLAILVCWALNPF